MVQCVPRVVVVVVVLSLVFLVLPFVLSLVVSPVA